MPHLFAQLNRRMEDQQRQFDHQLQQQEARFDQTTRDIDAMYQNRLAEEQQNAARNTERIFAQTSPRMFDMLRNMDPITRQNLTMNDFNGLMARFANEAAEQIKNGNVLYRLEMVPYRLL